MRPLTLKGLAAQKNASEMVGCRPVHAAPVADLIAGHTTVGAIRTIVDLCTVEVHKSANLRG